MSAQQLLRTAVRPMQQASSTCAFASRLGTSRTFSSLPTLRPSLNKPSSVFRSPTLQQHAFSPSPITAAAAAGEAEAVADVVPKTAISAHPAFGAMQIRCGPRATMATTSRLVQKRRHGFLSRIRTKNGQRLLKRRIAKGRKKLSA